MPVAPSSPSPSPSEITGLQSWRRHPRGQVQPLCLLPVIAITIGDEITGLQARHSGAGYSSRACGPVITIAMEDHGAVDMVGTPHRHRDQRAWPQAWRHLGTPAPDMQMLLVDFSQLLRMSHLDEIVKLANDLTDLADVCALNELAENCGKSLHTLVGEKLCSVKSLGKLAACCEKQEPERNQCFLKHKDDDLDILPLPPIDPSATCTAFHQFEQKVLGTFIYEIARRYPYFYGPELLYYTQAYKETLTECCKDAGADARLGPKLDALRKEVLRSAYRGKFKCSMLQNSGEKALQKWFISELSKRFPNADFMVISKLATDFTKVHKECCQSDMLECADDWADLTKYMCENQTSISPKLKECCNKPVLEKSHCLAEKTGDNSDDNVVANMAAKLAVVKSGTFVENKDVCKNYMEAKEDFLGKFLYEYSRRHPDYSVSLLLRLAQMYEATLEKCCATDDAQACYSKVLFKVLNSLCVAHEKSPVSDRVTKCCAESLVNRPSCFYALEVDETYVPKEFSAETFTFHADVCTLPEPEQQIKKQTALAELLKHKPKATEEQLKTVMGNFSAFFQKCCAAADKEACFAEEVLESSSF
ncbi:Serum albumin [Myotis brandtii]|uniref:Albumin n=1 Tax=Myotis brandtii TaxID=109478 RepID=S7N7I3_MYOBR|nr:Serum albumin [Myotis brandtii]